MYSRHSKASLLATGTRTPLFNVAPHTPPGTAPERAVTLHTFDQIPRRGQISAIGTLGGPNGLLHGALNPGAATLLDGTRDSELRVQEDRAVIQAYRVQEFASIATVALRRLVAIDSAQSLSDLLIPPSNRLETLSSNRKGQHSIRINDQYRICFTWRDGNAKGVEITKHYR